MGKSTLAHQLRQEVNYCSQINFTGFAEDGAEGLNKISHYYSEWLSMFEQFVDSDFTFICDRMFFSEMVYSQLCKSYNFRPYYEEFVERLATSCDRVTLFHLTVSGIEEIEKRTIRDKVKFKDIGDSVDEVLKQKDLYDELFTQFRKIKTPNVTLHEIDTTEMELYEVKNLIMDTLR